VIIFYNIFRLLYFNSIRLAANWNTKARLWNNGRKNWQHQLRQNWTPLINDKVVWMHCASLGEFEQGRPVLEKIKSQNPKIRILITFFSPSGYEIRKNYEGADWIMYLPADSKKNAEAFINMVQPSVAIFVKYEFWHFYLAELKQRNIETILISGIFRNTQPFFKWWGGFYKNMLLNFSHLFVQDTASAKLLSSINLHSNVTVCGDTRFDRVLEQAQHWQPIAEVETFIQPTKKIMVAGSTWKEDEEMIAAWFEQNKKEWQLIIAPHEIDAAHIQQLQKTFSNSILFTQTTARTSSECLIINTIGHLSKLYKYAHICYVGGGFTKSGHHNILEAAVYGKPVITGPVFEKYKESVELKQLKGCFTVSNSLELEKQIAHINVNETGKIAGDYVVMNSGATNAILNYLQEKRLFTSA
jgi:3-deoxy-D-manno-octulosonic-acid transferase